MSAVTASVYAKLVSDPTLTGLVSTYRGQPAIFTVDPAPEDAPFPFIVTSGEVGQSPFDTKTGNGRDMVRDIRCYTASTGSAALVEQIAERVRTLFHRTALTVAGYDMILSMASGPIVNDGVEFSGRVVSVRLVIMEQP